MAVFQNPFIELAAQVRRGAPLSANRFANNLHPQLRRLIRRTIRGGRSDAPLCRSIDHEAMQMGTNWYLLNSDDDELIEELARRIGKSIVDRLQQARPARPEDTVTNRGIAETIYA